MDYDNLIFLHIPKAAGSTLHPVLERHYSKRAYRTISVPDQLEAFKQMPDEERRRIHLLKGHMPFGMHTYLTGSSRYITLLRHPAERVVSHYYYVKRRPGHYLHHHLESGMGLAEFASAGLSGEMDNGQVRLLSGHDQDIPCGQCTRDLLGTAKRNIEDHFAVAGLTERFDESLVLMAIELGWNWTPYYLNLNVTKDKPVAKQIDPIALKAIEQANPLDFELYEWASRRFQTQLARRQPEVDARIAQLNRANTLYRPWGSLADSLKRNFKSRLLARVGASA
ncbi:MAG: sulfotransferase family 2 domain-containing protein [Thiobacillus sp.]|nr:sulfotransferase family 2 domain-containing protein [Thiobacillus sp.]